MKAVVERKQKTCCFTGHRSIRAERLPILMQKTEQIVRELIANGVIFFCVGGAVGYDTEVAKLLFRLQESEFPQIKVILIYPFDGFTDSWTPMQQEAYWLLYPKYFKVICVAQKAGRAMYLKRDRQLVDCSAFCICYCTRKTGGTAYTVRYAMQKGLRVFHIID